MRKNQLQVHKLTILSMMIALDVVLTPIFRIEGMAPMSSVVNILAGYHDGASLCFSHGNCDSLYPYDDSRDSAFSSHRSDFLEPF